MESIHSHQGDQVAGGDMKSQAEKLPNSRTRSTTTDASSAGLRPSQCSDEQAGDGGASSLLRIGIVTVSDRASRGIYEDRSGPAIEAVFAEIMKSPWVSEYRCVEDEQQKIEAVLIELADEVRCPLIVTTGGTGPALRDVTPEATEAVCDKMMPGFGECMRAVSLQHVPTAILSRQTAGLRGQSLIINLPGKPQAIRECLDAVLPAVPYCIELLGGPLIEFDPDKLQAFRPRSA